MNNCPVAARDRRRANLRLVTMTSELHRPDLHLVTIAPGKAPGGVWVRICTDDRLLSEYAITNLQQLEAQIDCDAAIVVEAGHVRVWTRFYDGDTGACMRTIIKDP